MSDKPSDIRARKVSGMGDGWGDNLTPLEALDVTQAQSFDAMLQQMSKTAFGGRTMGEAADVMYEMFNDPDCFVVGTFAGAMTIAKMGLCITEMIDQGMLNAVVSTGALMCHGLVEMAGRTHFKHDPSWSDEKLFAAGYDRVYDTLELEKNLYDAQTIANRIFESFGPDEAWGSAEFNRRLGKHLVDSDPRRGILQSAYKKEVPVFVPAFTDSEIGLDAYTYHWMAENLQQGHALRFEPLRDLGEYYRKVKAAKKVGIFTIGGGVPRNWAQQIGPLGEVLHKESDGKTGGLIRFHYGVRICPEPVHWGGLSGCTYTEGVSWGKFVPREEGGRFAEVLTDATVAWPILLRGVLERMGRV